LLNKQIASELGTSKITNASRTGYAQDEAIIQTTEHQAADVLELRDEEALGKSEGGGVRL
jgi:hypothetical protein